MHFTGKLALKVGAVGIAAGAILAPMTAAHATGPTLTATPSTGLHDGDVLAITGSGFAASASYNLVECDGAAPLGADCDLAHLAMGTTAADGTITTSYTVHTGTFGGGSCDSTSATCFLAASTDGGTTSGVQPLTFAAAPMVVATPHTGLKNGDVVSVTGTGFAASTAYSLVECSSPGLAGCDVPAGIVGGTTDASGGFTHSYTVKTGPIGNGTCAEGSDTCILAASTDGGGPDSGAATLSFAAKAGATVTVKPATNVVSGSKVTAVGSGFPHKKTVYAVECSGTGGQADCDTTALGSGQTSSTGTFSVKVPVHSGKVGAGSCKPGKVCYIIATTDTTGKDPNQTGVGTFSFGTGHVAKPKATKTSAKYLAKKHAIAGKVTAGGKGVKGLKTKLEIKKGKSFKAVASATTHKGGKVLYKHIKKSGTYKIKTLKNKKYKSSTSKPVKV